MLLEMGLVAPATRTQDSRAPQNHPEAEQAQRVVLDDDDELAAMFIKARLGRGVDENTGDGDQAPALLVCDNSTFRTRL